MRYGHIKALLCAIDASPCDGKLYEAPPPLAGIKFSRGSIDDLQDLNGYKCLFALKAQIRRDNGTDELIKARVYRARGLMGTMAGYLQMLRDKVIAADYGKPGQQIESGSDDIVFCTKQVKFLCYYRPFFDVTVFNAKTGATKFAYVFRKKDPSEVI